MCYTLRKGNHRARRLPSIYGGANPPDERKEGVANDVTYSDLKDAR